MSSSAENLAPNNIPISCSQNHDSPAIWKASRNNSTWYLFGSMHVLSKQIKWQSSCLMEILNQSDTLWLEAPTNPDNNHAGSYSRKHFNWIQRLSQNDVSTLLSAKQLEQLKNSLEQLNVRYEWIVSKPLWHIDAILSAAWLQHKQYYNHYGVEQVLGKLAHDKKIRYLENAAQQRKILENLPLEIQQHSLMKTLDAIKNNDPTLETLTNAWQQGNINQLSTILKKNTHPEIHRELIRNRNHNWARQLAGQTKKSPQTSLLVVGAGHLCGDNSLTHLLRKQGFNVQRIH